MINQFENILGKKNVLLSEDDTKPFLSDWRGNFTGKAKAVLLPNSTDEVSKILQIADQESLPIVPQGGNTGLVGGGIPDDSGNSIILSLSKMNKIRNFSITNKSMVVEAGCILQDLQELAEKKNLFFPLNLAAKGSCNIGGNLSTNAGGVNVLKYGNTRDLCLGIEAVLFGGKIINLLSPLRKDNTGYDLKNLFIGSEGTLGIITAASMKLFPMPNAIGTAVAGIDEINQGVELLNFFQSKCGNQIEAFEIIPANLIKIVLKHFPKLISPLTPLPPYLILFDISNPNKAFEETDSNGRIPIIMQLEELLEEAFNKKLIIDATIANNENQRKALWEIRENASEAIKNDSPMESFKKPNNDKIIDGKQSKRALLNFDISVTCDKLQTFFELASKEVLKIHPSARICSFGHIGDGNFHFNILDEIGGSSDWKQKKVFIEKEIYNVLFKLNGSISAEHGIGKLKAELLAKTKDKTAIEIMKKIKLVFDPKGLLNPGKIIR